MLKDASRKGRWRRQRAAEIVLENDAEGRRMLENVLKGDLDCGAGSSLERTDLSEEMSEDGCRAGSSLEPDLSEEVSEDGCVALLSDVDSFRRIARVQLVRVVNASLVSGKSCWSRQCFLSGSTRSATVA